MIRIEHCTVIRRLVEDVFTVVSDVEGWPRWNRTAREARLTSPGPVGLGTTFRLAGTILGRTVEADHQVTAYEPNRIFAARTLSGPFLATGTYTFEPVPEGARLTVTVEGEPAGMVKFGSAMLAPAVKKQVETQQGRLKELLEGPNQSL